MTPPSFGPWDPLGVEDVVRLLRGAPFRWWLTGGYALELHLGTSWRSHADIDVGICRSDAPEVHRWLSGRGWDLHIGAGGRLTPWHGEALDPARSQNNVWCRRAPGDDWRLDITVGSGTPERWVYRRDETVTRPWDDAVLRTPAGVPYLAPELQLLFKSKGLRPRDHLDAAHAVPHLTPPRRRVLHLLLPPDHPWQALLDHPNRRRTPPSPEPVVPAHDCQVDHVNGQAHCDPHNHHEADTLPDIDDTG
jgi:hypothetical protein